MNTSLVIVESPTKARTLAKFLGKGYQIEASMGHVRDLPKSEMGIDTQNDFEPKYIIPRDKKKKANELKKLAKNAKTIYLATDPDREGEAIAWHIAQLLESTTRGTGITGTTGSIENSGTEPRDTRDTSKTRGTLMKRVVFHEITESAIKDAFSHPRDLDYQLIDAQQARRVLDRLVGYKLSPVLWKKVKRGLSAGRVQSVALRLIVEREREIEAFKPVEYWSIEAELEKKSRENFIVELIEVDGKKIEVGNQLKADELVAGLKNASYSVKTVTKKEVKRNPQAPFTTSTLQQTAGNKLGYSSKKTMMMAQNLYEQGLITYMRTDSVTLSGFAIQMARSFIDSTFGKDYLPNSPRQYTSKSKNAQEAHEAIRPTNLQTSPESLKDHQGFTRDHLRLYDLIWKRTVASQMAEALMDQTTVDVTATSTTGGTGITGTTGSIEDFGNKPRDTRDTSNTRDTFTLRATGSILKFDGWLKLYGVKQITEENGEEAQKSKNQILPELSEGEPLDLLNLLPEQHFTQPPPRFTEASLVKKLEELGIGRPSTYAPIISTIQDRFYVEKVERKFNPTSLGLAVNDFLIKYFPDVFDYEFTAQMEDKLDEISRGERSWKATIGQFYTPFEKKVEVTEEKGEKVKLEVETVDKNCPKCGKQLVVRTGRFGKFLACSGFPECKHTEALEQKLDIKCPEDGGEVVLRKTKRGKTFYGCKNWPECKFASWTKPKA
ncbi:MAG: topoisomerase protein [Candidatus Woesebacteria bacterium GW2011_GWB1_38_5b]|uniref:DNA topoisomerase 1 n=4 Tax=Microgenomates group TaxID=1794810 RepID=A0A1F5K4I2_9BACT|nr:MAG: topoisomerase protein [Candidatus Daviesbacteria bacterium GW2011_GWA1_36_8]KKQ75789.1 MAG: topoisomerase protein [Candidatus Woesebacteria bacterium GW2011_GWB1_38_5b]OGE16811.1 MAG: DNA topoisomerase I [Candidatus Daviesbacteria bacterium RIFCSPHIGHO2_01_FULL_36_37]OGE32933.1 MAG: DNA topoisomerase I [Candidatus Daviesbacteria bacterium RIFCSPHIGHO2_02_FULL_37_9]OGE35799.1 MAG: DNA topoisomerase I [Candidatus Daviesbacteria bacterium RIFCSPHIGHO2_12_FULL_37_16]